MTTTGPSCFFLLDVPFEDTLTRHQTRPEATAFSELDMRGITAGCAGSPGEVLLESNSNTAASAGVILQATGWSDRQHRKAATAPDGAR